MSKQRVQQVELDRNSALMNVEQGGGASSSERDMGTIDKWTEEVFQESVKSNETLPARDAGD